MRTTQNHQPKNIETFKQNLLLWSQQFDDVVWLDSNNHNDEYSSYDAVLAVDAFTAIRTDYFDAFERLKDYQLSVNDWIFGYLAYDLKNTTERLKSENLDGLDFPDLYFFQPKKLFLFKDNQVEIQYLKMVDDEIADDLLSISSCVSLSAVEKSQNPIKIKLRIHKDDYFAKVTKMLTHIHRGDIYEANFCQEFYAENSEINPIETFKRISDFYKRLDFWLFNLRFKKYYRTLKI